MSSCADAQVLGSLDPVTVPDSLIDEAARRFALLSDPTRLRILALLLEREPMTVTELSDSLGIATPNVSQHLARLSAGRLVGREKQGRTVPSLGLKLPLFVLRQPPRPCVLVDALAIS